MVYLILVYRTDLRWSGLRVRQGVEERLSKIEADLLCELIGVSNIMGFSEHLSLKLDFL